MEALADGHRDERRDERLAERLPQQHHRPVQLLRELADDHDDRARAHRAEQRERHAELVERREHAAVGSAEEHRRPRHEQRARQRAAEAEQLDAARALAEREPRDQHGDARRGEVERRLVAQRQPLHRREAEADAAEADDRTRQQPLGLVEVDAEPVPHGQRVLAAGPEPGVADGDAAHLAEAAREDHLKRAAALVLGRQLDARGLEGEQDAGEADVHERLQRATTLRAARRGRLGHRRLEGSRLQLEVGKVVRRVVVARFGQRAAGGCHPDRHLVLGPGVLEVILLLQQHA